jgi:hypothetical protein
MTDKGNEMKFYSTEEIKADIEKFEGIELTSNFSTLSDFDFFALYSERYDSRFPKSTPAEKIVQRIQDYFANVDSKLPRNRDRDPDQEEKYTVYKFDDGGTINYAKAKLIYIGSTSDAVELEKFVGDNSKVLIYTRSENRVDIFTRDVN